MEDKRNTYGRISSGIESITRIDFEIWSNANIIDHSATPGAGITVAETSFNGEIVHNGVLDKRLGVTNRIDECDTCGETPLKCPGHFGHIKFVEPVFHLGYLIYVKNILSCICIKCSRLLVHKNEKEINALLKNKQGKKRFFEIRALTKNVTHCQRVGCGVPAHKISDNKKIGYDFILAEPINKSSDTNESAFSKKKKSPQSLSAQFCYNILRAIPNEDIIIMGFDPKRSRPEDMITINFPVSPVAVRPSIKLELLSSSTNDDDLTHKLIDIVKSNENLKNAKGDGTLTKTVSACDDFILLQIHVATYFDNEIIGIPKSCQKSKVATKSLSQRLKGKEGRIRGNLMGKRVDQSGRTVITPDPYIDLNQVGIPIIIAMNLTYPEIVNKHNIEYLSLLVKNGRKRYPGANFVTKNVIDKDGNEVKRLFHLKYREKPIELAFGDIVDRHLINGDIVLFNRQPSLHKMSMMGHKIHVLENEPKLLTFRVNVSCTEPYNADYDGDEMNIHVPQSLPTVTELMLIADAAKRFVNPRVSQIAFVIKQDTLMGSYLITHDDILIDWKDAMNLLSYTKNGLNGRIPKGKMVSGKYLYSQIIQSEINISKKEKDGTFATRIFNGMITHGKFAKSEIQAIIQKTWRQYGSEKSVNFVDDLQRVILQWLMIHGFTVSIRDLVIPKKTHKTIETIIETKRKEVLMAITEFDNNSAVPLDVFELSLEAGLATIQSDVNKAVMNSFSIPMGINMTIKSGSAGDANNAGQNVGCVGQIVVERQRIAKKYNNRSLPMFHQYDNSAFARGFCTGSYLSGLKPHEYFFGIMAGREGVINTAIKTAETGYIQRKLVKILEDIGVKYDGTVRNANDKIIQFVYGDSAFNTEKQVDVKIELVGSNNADISSNYVYTNEELSALRKKHNVDEKYTEDINNKLYKKLLSMRNQLRKIQRRTNLKDVEFKEMYMVPVDLGQFITNIMNRPGRKNEDLVDPYYVITNIKNAYSNLNCKIMKYNEAKSEVKQKDDMRIKFLLKLYLFDVLSPKKCTHKYKLSQEEFDEVMIYYYTTFLLAKIEGGEMVGFISAHGIGEPVTQSNLKSFHKAGSGAATTVTEGLPRVRELLSITKKIKAPRTTIVLDDNCNTNKAIATKIASHLKYTVVKDIIEKVNIIYDPKPNDKNGLMAKDGLQNVFEVPQSKSGCTSEISGLPWVIRLVLSKEKMIDRGVNMLEFKTSFCHNWSIRYEDAKTNKKEYKKIIDKITQCAIVSNYDNSTVPIIHIRFNANNYNSNTLIKFQEMIVGKYRIKGIVGITNGSNIVEEPYITFDEDGTKVEKKRWTIQTEGINLQDITQINGINLEETICNDIASVYDNFGVEAARTIFIREFTKAIESSGGSSNYQHVELLADTITHMGGLIAVNRHGANKLDTDPFSRASFEKTVEQMLAAAAFGESDHIRSVSSCIMAGALINGGTGCFDLLLDHVKVKLAVPPAEAKEIETTVMKKSTVISDLIKKKNIK